MKSPTREPRPQPVAVLALAAVLLGCGPGEPDPAGDAAVERAQEAPRRDTGAPAAERPPGSPAASRGGEPRREPRAAAPEPSPTPPTPPDTTGVATGPGAEEIDPAEIPTEAYQACKDSVAVQLANPGTATWGKLPETVERTPGGDYVLAGRVRPDSLSPGISFVCAVRSAGNGWRVAGLQVE